MPQTDYCSELLQLLSHGAFKPGDKLPTIEALKSEQLLGLSVSKIREQLEVARALGLIEIRPKTGMRLREYSFAPAVQLSLNYALARDASAFLFFHDLRIQLELAYWDTACTQLSTADKRAMAEAIHHAQIKLSTTPGPLPTAEHRQFHMQLYSHLENPFVTGLLNTYWDTRETIDSAQCPPPATLKQSWAAHQSILDYICQRDYTAARHVFIEHVQPHSVPQTTEADDAVTLHSSFE